MTAKHEAWVRGAGRLEAAGIETARLDARVLLAHAMNVATDELLSSGAPSADEMARYEELLERRAAREPAAYITGEREFWSLPFAVGPGVLVPRPETETLLEEALRAFPDRTRPLEILDLGTGSGCLLIASLSEYPNARGVGVDKSDIALGWARRNAVKNGVVDRCDLQKGSWSAAAGRTFDMIFANPPYVSCAERERLAPEIARYEPPEALFAGEDGLEAYRALAPALAAALKPDGWGGLEIGAGQREPVCDIMTGSGLEVIRVAPDVSGVPRCVSVCRRADKLGHTAEKTVGNARSSR
jgi:release factor glutamine methyltransferase